MDELNFDDIQLKVHRTAREHGWWDETRTFGDLIALIHSEVSEALEEFRANNGNVHKIHFVVQANGARKPVGVPVELADVIIRVMDMAEGLGIPLLPALLSKIEYNDTRDYRHGGKAL